MSCFNTQPPEGGWLKGLHFDVCVILFQHTAARRRLDSKYARQPPQLSVSTHSRPKAAGGGCQIAALCLCVSTHSRPKAAGLIGAGFAARRNRFNTQPPEGGWDKDLVVQVLDFAVSTHSRPKAAGKPEQLILPPPAVSTHSRPKAAGEADIYQAAADEEFQHTAARRRLGVDK